MHDSLMENMSDPRLENVLGAVAVAITGAVQVAVDEAAGHTAAGPAALSALRIHRGCSVDHLAGVLGLTHSGTVRLVDRLAGDGLLTRGQGKDARVVTLDLTAKGTKRAERVSAARAVAVERFLGNLDRAERSTLMRLLEKVVATGVADWSEVQYRCRLCNLEACHAGGESCPLDVHMALLAR
jgi:MarR family transcriptional regulator, negative regulator of the multidrug operon emrRAB